MLGKAVFTSSEKENIEALLKELRSGKDRLRQRKIRNKLRYMGFYITDFDETFQGFTYEDFERLIENKQIRITD